MALDNKKIKEVREFLERKKHKIAKKVNIIFDGKQYNIRIPLEFAKKTRIDHKKDLFEFTLVIPEDKSKLPSLRGDLIEKE